MFSPRKTKHENKQRRNKARKAHEDDDDDDDDEEERKKNKGGGGNRREKELLFWNEYFGNIGKVTDRLFENFCEFLGIFCDFFFAVFGGFFFFAFAFALAEGTTSS
jgi:hypothetical protein